MAGTDHLNKWEKMGGFAGSFAAHKTPTPQFIEMIRQTHS
jgi:hypothetical protein